MSDEPAVNTDGTLHHVSASQIKTFQRCQRRWHFDKVLRVPSESSPDAEAGSAIHLELETYYNTGAIPIHEGARNALKHLPPRDPSLLVETELTDPPLLAAGIPVSGYVDLVVTGFNVNIIDYKTANSFRYAKKPAELLKDIQMGSYGFWARRKFPEAKTLTLTHVYILRKPPYSVRVVSAPCEWSQTENVWQEVEASTEKMKAVAKLKKGEPERNEDACRDYGGCPYFSKCYSIEERLDMYDAEDV